MPPRHINTGHKLGIYFEWIKYGHPEGLFFLREGCLDYWLDPALPLRILEDPASYRVALRGGWVSALQAVAQGEYLVGRVAARTKDSFGVLRTVAQEAWAERDIPLDRLLHLFPYAAIADVPALLLLDPPEMVSPRFQNMVMMILLMIEVSVPDLSDTSRTKVIEPLRRWAVDPLRSSSGFKEIIGDLPLYRTTATSDRDRPDIEYACQWLRSPDGFQVNFKGRMQGVEGHQHLINRLTSHLREPPCLPSLPSKDLWSFDEYPDLLEKHNEAP